mgnify:CR=1 FL=1
MSLRDDYEPLVERYKREMLIEFSANEHKESWKRWSLDKAMGEIHYHVAKLEYATRHTNTDGWDKVREYAADIGNMAAMLIDCLQLWTPESEAQP